MKMINLMAMGKQDSNTHGVKQDSNTHGVKQYILEPG